MTDIPGVEPGRREPAPEDAPPARRSSEDRRSAQAHVRAARTELESQIAQARAEFDQRNERLKERTGRDLIVAILIALAIAAVFIASLVFFKWLFVVFALAAATIGVFELTRALQTSGRRVDLVPQLIAGTLLIGSALLLDPWLHWVMAFVAVALVVVWRMMAQMVAADGRTYGDVLSDVLVGALTQLYVPFLGSLCVVLLRQDGGEWWVLGFIIVAASCDIGAYAAGLSFGKHPMAPRISPKKTWEGFAGSAATALVAGVLVCLLLLGLPWWAGLIFGPLVLATATIGDLGESMIKRDLGIKDMSSWLPGHGGVLDRLDSILPSTVPALALYYLLTPLAA